MRRRIITILGTALLLLAAGCEKQVPTGVESKLNQTEKFIPGEILVQDIQEAQGPALSKVMVTPPVWEPNFGTGLNQFDDDCDFVSFGFTFYFYGVAYSGVWINSNGNMTFNSCNWDWWHPDIPDGSNIVIGPLYGDFNPWAAGDVYYNTVGAAPNRIFVVTWADVPEYIPSGYPRSTFQVQLFEGSNSILFGYNGLGTDGVNWAYSSPSTDANMDVGISSGTGSFVNSASGTAIPALDGTNICYSPTDGGYTETFGSCEIEVAIDIKPGSDPNSINPKSKGKIPVAVLTTDDFDASDVDASTITLGDDDGNDTPVAARKKGTLMAELEDVDGDNDLDLILHFETRALVDNGDLDGSTTELVLNGQTTGGQAIKGSDSVNIVGGAI